MSQPLRCVSTQFTGLIGIKDAHAFFCQTATHDMKKSLLSKDRIMTDGSRFEQRLRVSVAFGLLAVGLASLFRGYQLAFGAYDNRWMSSGGYQVETLYIVVALLGWIACILSRRLRLLSWAFIAALAWWSVTTTDQYLRGLYVVVGQDGCVRCDEQITELHLSTTVLAVASACWVLAFRGLTAIRWANGLFFLALWLYITIGVCANDG